MQPRRRGRDTEFVTPQLAYGFIVLVGGSAGLMAGFAGATAIEAALLLVLGLAMGVGLLVAIGIRPWSDKQ
jgi:hypothetical protein